MQTITRTIELAGLDEINPKFNVEKFKTMLTNDDPDCGSNHLDGKCAVRSWYHPRDSVNRCTTIFYSRRPPTWVTGTYPPDCGEFVANGHYHGEPGEWRLYKQGSAGKAPYEE